MWKILHKLGLHKWVYRNPYDRMCSICHKRQNEFVHVFEGENPFYKKGQWEDVYPIPQMQSSNKR